MVVHFTLVLSCRKVGEVVAMVGREWISGVGLCCFLGSKHVVVYGVMGGRV